MHHLRFRQVHLDFHTSPKIKEVGKHFDKAQFQAALKAGHVNSITCFATCHHGMSYYDTRVGVKHPNLDFDLLRAQFDAAKEVDVNVPIYLTAGVHNEMAEQHPEWRMVGSDGRYVGWVKTDLEPGFKQMCFNSPFIAHLCEQIREVVTLFPDCDGIFLDIISQPECCCQSCMALYAEQGLDAREASARKQVAQQGLMRYYRETTAAAKYLDENMPVFHNSGHVMRGGREVLKYFSHLELESLPTGGWGYDHFPISAKYTTLLEHDVMGMTGKFHTTWGEFGGFKHPNALRYECAAMIAFGAKCSVGDQLHPSGRMDESTYELIGAAYAEVEAKETYCDDVKNIAEIAVLSSDAVNRLQDTASDIGVGRVLLEEHLLFDLLDPDMDFSPYAMMILPDDIPVNDALKARLDDYLAKGGKLLLSGTSGIGVNGPLFDIGATWEGESEFSPNYILPVPDLRPDWVRTPMVMYAANQKLKVTDGESLGEVYDPYFNRTYAHFSSHQHTPNRPEPSGYDCGVLNGAGNILTLAHPVFTVYRGIGAVAYRCFIGKAIRKLLGRPMLDVEGLPSTGRVTLMRQAKENRDILHLLYANTISRGGEIHLPGGNLDNVTKGVEVIEELTPLQDLRISLNTNRPIRRLSLQPQNVDLLFEQNGDRIEFTVDKFTCHQMVEMAYDVRI